MNDRSTPCTWASTVKLDVHTNVVGSLQLPEKFMAVEIINGDISISKTPAYKNGDLTNVNKPLHFFSKTNYLVLKLLYILFRTI